ncbi:hypothetical protein OWM07_10960 [Deferribacter thermophilus]|uniref:hypothetical protein n=1 Tax=Deferribacter thermophilus TaxID=53573 RepID=UPI003C282114
MDELSYLKQEINQLKSDTYLSYSKKVEIAHKMLLDEKNKLNRLKKIKEKVLLKLSDCKKRRKKAVLNELLRRLEKKIVVSNQKIIKLNNIFNKYLEDFKRHREYLGLYDHSFINSFYKD